MEAIAVTKEWILENYNKFNKQYWNGELPNIEAKVTRAKNTFGYASWRWNGTKMSDFKISMSNYYNLTDNSLKNTLLHEMVHIADYYFHPEHFIVGNQKVKGYDAHGPIFFLKQAERLNKDGWNITKFKEKEEMEGSCLSEKVKERLEKPYILVVFADGNTGNTCVQKVQKKQIPELKRLLESFNFVIKGVYETNYKKYSEKRCSMKTYYTEIINFENHISALSKIEGFIFKKLDVL